MRLWKLAWKSGDPVLLSIKKRFGTWLRRSVSPHEVIPKCFTWRHCFQKSRWLPSYRKPIILIKKWFCRGVFRTQSNISDGAFCFQLLFIFEATLHHRFSAGYCVSVSCKIYFSSLKWNTSVKIEVMTLSGNFVKGISNFLRGWTQSRFYSDNFQWFKNRKYKMV